MNTFDKQTADEQWSHFVSWWSDVNEIKDGKVTKKPSPSINDVYIAKSENTSIERK